MIRLLTYNADRCLGEDFVKIAVKSSIGYYLRTNRIWPLIFILFCHVMEDNRVNRFLKMSEFRLVGM